MGTYNFFWLSFKHWTHICLGKLTIIGSYNGLSQFSEISKSIQTFPFKKMHLKMWSVKWRPFCLSLNLLLNISFSIHMMALSQKNTRTSLMCAWNKFMMNVSPSGPSGTEGLTGEVLCQNSNIKDPEMKRTYWWLIDSCCGYWQLPISTQLPWWWSVSRPPIPLTVFRSNSKFDKNFECCSLKSVQLIATKFCTSHDSYTVVTYAKFRWDQQRTF